MRSRQPRQLLLALPGEYAIEDGPSPIPATPAPLVRAVGPPSTGRWIDVDVTKYVVRLMDGQRAMREIGPVAVGREVDGAVFDHRDSPAQERRERSHGARVRPTTQQQQIRRRCHCGAPD